MCLYIYMYVYMHTYTYVVIRTRRNAMHRANLAPLKKCRNTPL